MTRLELPDDQPITSRLSGAGSLRRELEAVLEAATPQTTNEAYRRLIIEENVAGKGSASMRMWTWRRLNVRYLLDPDVPEFRAFFWGMTAASDATNRGLLAYLMMARTDRLFREVVAATVTPAHRNRRATIDTTGVREIVDARGRMSGLQWSEASAKNIANHVLSSLKDFGVLSGSATRKLEPIRSGPAVTVFASRLGRLEGLSDRRLLESRWFELLGVDLPQVLNLMYAAAQEGSLQFRFQADVAELTLPQVEVAS